MKTVKNIIAAVLLLALAVVVIWYYASGQEHKNQNTLRTTSATQAAENQIKANWTKFFAGTTAAQGKISLLQNGQEFAQVIEAQAQSPTAKATSVTVSNVKLDTNTTATVTYTINIAGSPVLSNQTGQAVYSNGTWMVGDGAFCGLLKLGGTLPPNCPGATSH